MKLTEMSFFFPPLDYCPKLVKGYPGALPI